MEKQILHIDCNKFYASVECFLHPEYRNKPLAVGGCREERHGIILTKNEIAAKYDIQVGEALWQAKNKCPDLIIVKPNFPVYVEFSKKVRRIFDDYTDLIEPFGLDEAWLDVTGDWYKSGEEIAYEIKERVKNEVGITVSAGVSFNKIFAKLGSDYKKPDAVTVINRANFRDIVWSLPCGDMIMVGKATQKKLSYYGINTLGELANTDERFMKSILGKNGVTLRQYARGEDMTPVMKKGEIREIKSVGNSTTTSRDLENGTDVKIVFTSLAESVAKRMRKLGLKGSCVSVYIRDNNLKSFTRQRKLASPTDVTLEIINAAMSVFCDNYDISSSNPIRTLGLSVSDFTDDTEYQFDFDKTVERREKLERLDKAVDVINEKYGLCVRHGSLLIDEKLAGNTGKEDDYRNYIFSAKSSSLITCA